MTETTPTVHLAGDSDSQDVGTAPCEECAHPDCRGWRASQQSRVRGHTAEFTAEHRIAVVVQARHPGVVVWFGEATQSFWAATPAGLTEASDVETLVTALSRHVPPDMGPAGSAGMSGTVAVADDSELAGPPRTDGASATGCAASRDSGPLLLSVPTFPAVVDAVPA